jgi:hypothetical protein
MEANLDYLNAGYMRKRKLRAERAAAQDEKKYVPCSGCGLRNYDTDDPLWNCPDFPECRASVPW